MTSGKFDDEDRAEYNHSIQPDKISYCTRHNKEYTKDSNCPQCFLLMSNEAHSENRTAGGLRYNLGKAELSMILEAKHALTGLAEVLTFGAKKYARGNWRKGLSHTQICDSLLRHLTAYLSGENLDPETKLPHVNHIHCNAMFLAEMAIAYPDLDDRSSIEPNTWDRSQEFLDSREIIGEKK